MTKSTKSSPMIEIVEDLDNDGKMGVTKNMDGNTIKVDDWGQQYQDSGNLN